MAEGGKKAVISCPICLIELSSRLKVMSCGHLLCEGCMETINKSREHRGKCPLCKKAYKKEIYTLFPDLSVVDATSTDQVLRRTRQRVVHVINPLGVMSSAEEIRDAYNTAREHRAEIRNMATGCNDPDFETLTVAVTDAVDALEERLHYSLQKQDLANSIVDMKKKLKAETAVHEATRASLTREVILLKHKYRLEEKERNKATAALDIYKERLNTAVSEQNQQARRAEQRGLQITTLQAQLDQTRAERGTFQAQLEEYRKKTIKQRALITQLKHEAEELKRKVASPAPSLKRSISKPLPAHPHPIDWRTLVQTPELIDLSSSSPTKTPSAQPMPGLMRKRPRAPDENHYRSAALPPPPKKVHVGSLPKPYGEVIETVSVRSNGEIRRLAAKVPRPTTTVTELGRPIANKPVKRTPESQLSLGQGGKLVAVAKKRRVRAV